MINELRPSARCVRLHLVDTNPLVAEALQESFRAYPEVEVRCADILELARGCVVSPANSFGFMDGGIDASYMAFFGLQLQAAVHEAITRRPGGMLPVGAALAVHTGHDRIPYIIVAPTMEIPGEVPATHAGRALRAALRVVDTHGGRFTEIYCPGLATAIGRVSPHEAAESMAAAYKDWSASHSRRIQSAGERQV